MSDLFRRSKLFPALFLLFFLIILIKTAWMSDDAYITMRSVDNFVHGYGLRWNVDERVQAFTHPLWMLLLSGLYFFFKEGYFTPLLLSMALSLATAGLIIARIADSWRAAVFAVAALLFSSSLVTYSTSGLENPLGHFLMVLFFITWLGKVSGGRKVFLLSLITSLIVLNRQDVILLILPLYLLGIWEERVWWSEHYRKLVGVVLLGFLPIIFWEIFSLLYFGTIFPNTYYAKLGTGVSHIELVRHGLNYLLVSMTFDPVGFLLMAAALIVAFWKKNDRGMAIIVGLLLYSLYAIWIGGDFMSGRFFSSPILLSVLLLSRSNLFPSDFRLATPLVLMALMSLQSPYSPVFSASPTGCGVQRFDTRGVGDERSCYYDGTGLLKQDPKAPYHPNHGLADAGVKARSRPEPIFIAGAIGMFGYFAGPEKHIVDINGLADPLLARLPIPPEKSWRIGHFERLIPGGYLESLAWHENRICEPHLHHFYDQLTRITQDDLLDAARLQAIWQMNTFQLDADIEAYIENALTEQALLCNAQQIVDIPFAGGPRLRGYALSARSLHRGDGIIVIAYWQKGEEKPAPVYSFAHIRNSWPDWPMNPRSGNDIWAQAEHMQPGGRFTTDYWPPQIYADLFFLTIPDDMPPGEYHVEIGWFDPQTGEQLDPADEAIPPPLKELWHSLLLPSITVQ